jgi:quercetin dioxygenase-like cupin family protein
MKQCSHSALPATRRALFAMFTLLLLSTAAHAQWLRDDTSVAWQQDGQTRWKFSFDPGRGKPFFHPLSVASGVSLTEFQPEDHPWHYGLWFSWKYINGVNYWEEDRQSGKAEGTTRWNNVRVDTHPDGSADIKLDLAYVHPSGRVDMTESRELHVSAVDPSGGYSIDWRATFTAGQEGAELGRTPMPGEPDGKMNGGYGGLSVRLAAAPTGMTVVTPDGPVEKFENDRARPAAMAVAANFMRSGNAVGALAMLSDPANIAERAPWYVVNSSTQMRFLCAAILAPEARKLPPHGQWKLRYRIILQRDPWTPQTLSAAALEWNRAAIMHSAVIDWNEVPAKQADVRVLRQFLQGPTATLDELEMHATTLAPGESSHAPHTHPNEEIVIIKEGTVEAFSNGVWKRVGPGSVIFNASNEAHAIRNVGSGPATYHVINWRAAPRLSSPAVAR